jgi:YegS/Rv2252/BmrU family lipid kinase
MLDCHNIVIANEKANWGANRATARQVVDFLRRQGLPCCAAVTSHAGHATELAATAAAEKAHTVVVVGGDGTLNEVVHGLCASGQSHTPRLGIVPAGSSNDFSKSLGIPPSWRQACRTILKGRIRGIDLGQAGPHYFCSASCLGYFAEIAAGSLQMKGFGGSLRYVIPALGVIRKIGPGWEMNLTADGRIFRGVYGVLLVGNAARFGGLTMLPHARPDDGVLDCLLIETGSPWEALQLIPLVYRKALARHRKVTRFQAARLSVTLNHPTLVCHDGQMCPARVQNIEYRVLPQRLPVLC